MAVVVLLTSVAVGATAFVVVRLIDTFASGYAG